MQETDDQTDSLARNEHRGVWLALGVVLVLAATLILATDTRRALLQAMSIGIVFVVIWLSQQRTRGTREAIQARREIVMQDEWRQAALTQAYKWAFLMVLATLALFCLVSTLLTVPWSAQMLAALTVALGATTFLAVFLLRDGG